MKHKLVQTFALCAVLFAACAGFGQALTAADLSNYCEIKPSPKGPMQALKDAGYRMSNWRELVAVEPNGALIHADDSNASHLPAGSSWFLPARYASSSCAHRTPSSSSNDNGEVVATVHHRKGECAARCSVSFGASEQTPEPLELNAEADQFLADDSQIPGYLPVSAHSQESSDLDPSESRAIAERIDYEERYTRGENYNPHLYGLIYQRSIINVFSGDLITVPAGYRLSRHIKLKGKISETQIRAKKSFAILFVNSDSSRFCWMVEVDYTQPPACPRSIVHQVPSPALMAPLTNYNPPLPTLAAPENIGTDLPAEAGSAVDIADYDNRVRFPMKFWF